MALLGSGENFWSEALLGKVGHKGMSFGEQDYVLS